eukprot:4054204-Prymnesium_polylepis.1
MQTPETPPELSSAHRKVGLVSAPWYTISWSEMSRKALGRTSVRHPSFVTEMDCPAAIGANSTTAKSC